MKILFKLFLLTLWCVPALLSQDHQVTQQAPYSVAAPSIDVSNSLVHLSYGTNLYYYSFGLDGPSTPITSPVKPSPSSYGPYTVNIRTNNLSRYLTYIDRNVTLQRYEILFQKSTDGIAWSTPLYLETIQKLNSISLRPDNPILRTSVKGNVYCLYLNYSDTNKVYVLRSSNGGTSFDVKTRIAPLDTNNAEKQTLEMQVVAVGSTDNIFVFYSVGANIFMTRSVDEGITFSTPVKIGSLADADFGNFYSLAAAITSTGKIYLVCDQFGQAQPMINRSKTFIRMSDNFGANWTTGGTIDSLGYVNPKIVLTGSGTIACIKQRQNNIYILSSKNGITWSDTVRINTVPQKAYKHTTVLIDDNTIGAAWIDTRTGSDEIFYRRMSIPVAPVAGVAGISVPAEFMLWQNFPNPFNPNTTIRYALPFESKVTLTVYNVLGQIIDELVNREQSAGLYETVWNPHVASGLYFYQINAVGTSDPKQRFTEFKKMVLIK